MNRIILVCFVLSMFALSGVSYAGVGPLTLFTKQDTPVGYCAVWGVETDVCVSCDLNTVDSLTDGVYCGVDEARIGIGVEEANELGMHVIGMELTRTGNPVPGQFTHMLSWDGVGVGLENFDECPSSIDGCIDVEDDGACGLEEDGPIVVAVHSNVEHRVDRGRDTIETAWAAECLQDEQTENDGCPEWGTRFVARGSWATYVHVWCNTGLPGDCLSGRLACRGGEAFCRPVQTSPEVCDDGVDNDCDGYIDTLDEEDCPTAYECPCLTEEVLNYGECLAGDGSPGHGMCDDIVSSDDYLFAIATCLPLDPYAINEILIEYDGINWGYGLIDVNIDWPFSYQCWETELTYEQVTVCRDILLESELCQLWSSFP